MRVLSTSSLLIVCCLAITNSAWAQDTAPASSTVKVYRVADLVALPAVRETTLQKTVTQKEWSGEHSESIESLNKLATLIETIVSAENGAVIAHEDSLSLVVRHSPAGHEQMTALLEQLRLEERPVVELTLIPIVGLEGSERSFSDEQTGRLSQMIIKQILDSTETTEVVKLLESNPKQALNPLAKSIPVRLANGRKTQIHRWMMAIYVTAVLSADSNEIQFRIDNWSNEAANGRFVVQTQSFSVPTGHAVMFATSIDGSEMYWLAIPKKIEPEQKVTVVSGETP